MTEPPGSLPRVLLSSVSAYRMLSNIFGCLCIGNNAQICSAVLGFSVEENLSSAVKENKYESCMWRGWRTWQRIVVVPSWADIAITLRHHLGTARLAVVARRFESRALVEYDLTRQKELICSIVNMAYEENRFLYHNEIESFVQSLQSLPLDTIGTYRWRISQQSTACFWSYGNGVADGLTSMNIWKSLTFKDCTRPRCKQKRPSVRNLCSSTRYDSEPRLGLYYQAGFVNVLHQVVL